MRIRIHILALLMLVSIFIAFLVYKGIRVDFSMGLFLGNLIILGIFMIIKHDGVYGSGNEDLTITLLEINFKKEDK